MTSFILKAFNLFAEYGIPFINGFISFAGQIGEAFNALFDWLSPATEGAVSGFGSLFKGVTDFLATFKQHLVLFISAPIEAVLTGVFNGLAWIHEAVGALSGTIIDGLRFLKVISQETADAYHKGIKDGADMIRGVGKDLAEPFRIAQEDAMNEMADIFTEQAKVNKREQFKFKGFLDNFNTKFNSTVEKVPVVTVEALKKATASVSDKMSGMILSGSQEEARLKNSASNKTLEYQRKNLKATETIAEGVQNLGLV